MKTVKMSIITEMTFTEKEYKKILKNDLEKNAQGFANDFANKNTKSFVSVTLADGTKIEKVGKEE